jgi:hypothetical protein
VTRFVENSLLNFRVNRIFYECIKLLFVLSFVVISEERAQANQEEGTAGYISPINALLKTTIDKVGNSRSSVAAKVGRPLAITTEFIADPDTPLQDDRIHTLTYDGIIIWIYQAAASKKEKLLSVRMTKNRKELLPELIGKSKEYILSVFGQPASLDENRIEYDSLDDDESGLGVIELEFKNSSLDAIELTYYID